MGHLMIFNGNPMIQSVSFIFLLAASNAAAARLAEVIALSSQSLPALGASHTEPPVIHFVWAAQASFACVCIADILAHTGLISEVAVASHLHQNRAGWHSVSKNESSEKVSPCAWTGWKCAVSRTLRQRKPFWENKKRAKMFLFEPIVKRCELLNFKHCLVLTSLGKSLKVKMCPLSCMFHSFLCGRIHAKVNKTPRERWQKRRCDSSELLMDLNEWLLSKSPSHSETQIVTRHRLA